MYSLSLIDQPVEKDLSKIENDLLDSYCGRFIRAEKIKELLDLGFFELASVEIDGKLYDNLLMFEEDDIFVGMSDAIKNNSLRFFWMVMSEHRVRITIKRKED